MPAGAANKPIINKKCIACHGGVRAKAGFSLLFREEALAPTKSGKPAIIPGDPGNSELIRRITHTDPEERMPYKHEPLSAEEIAIFRDWIKQGANWGTHWAYIPLKPQTINTAAGDHAILPAGFECDMSAETLDRTTLGALPLGGRVHLERAGRGRDRGPGRRRWPGKTRSGWTSWRISTSIRW